jgi:hypothetical protein
MMVCYTYDLSRNFIAFAYLIVTEFYYCSAVLPFLDRTTFFLYPIGLVIILSPLSKCLFLWYCF